MTKPYKVERYEFRLPDWLRDGLFEMKELKGKKVNDIIVEALLEKYPALRDRNRTVIQRLAATAKKT